MSLSSLLRRPAATAVVALITATAAATPQPQSSQPPVDSSKPVAACDDFAAFAAARFTDAEQPDVFELLNQRSRERQIALLSQAASNPRNDAQRSLGNLWASAIAGKNNGTAALKPMLERIAALNKPRDLAPLIAEAQKQGLPLLFRFDVAADLRDQTLAIAYLRQAGLGLPDRDYYLRQDPQTTALMQHYRAYVERLLVLTGSGDKAAADAARVIDMETQLARASLSLSQLRDPNNSYLPTSIDALDQRYPALHLKDFVKTQGLRGIKTISLAHTAFFVQANHLAASASIESWRAYLRFHLIQPLAGYLGGSITEAHQTFVGAQLIGRIAPLDIGEQALQVVNLALPDVLSREFLAASDAASLQAARVMIDGETAALRQALEHADWLSEEARTTAGEKVDALLVNVGGDPGSVDISDLKLSRTDLSHNLLQIAAWRQRAALQRLGKAPAIPQLEAQQVNAYYDPGHNRLLVAAAIVAPPLFDVAGDPATRYGSFGALIGHEISHGFDLAGSKFDAQGHTKPWWTAVDYAAYAKRSEPLSVQYDAYKTGDVPVDGKRTFQENVADLAGLELAWAAFVAADKPGPAERDGLTPDQRFFLAWAQVWTSMAADAADDQPQYDLLQAPPRHRINGPLANMDSFAAAFDCKPGQGFLLEPEKRIHVWY